MWNRTRTSVPALVVVVLWLGFAAMSATLVQARHQVSWRKDWTPGERWQWLLQTSSGGSLDTRIQAPVYDLDAWQVSAEQVAALHAAGSKVICYFSAGSSENWRPDFSSIPSSVIGRNLHGWAGEKWLDIRAIPVIAPIMLARMDMAAAKGCDAVEPDNVDAYLHDTGFGITPRDSFLYNVWLAERAHERGLAIGLKNAVAQLGILEPYYDFAVNEECWHYNECFGYEVFLRNNKAVYGAEYNMYEVEDVCPAAVAMGMSVIFKELELHALPYLDCYEWAKTAGNPCRNGWCDYYSTGACYSGSTANNGRRCNDDPCAGVCVNGECDDSAAVVCDDGNDCTFERCSSYDDGMCEVITRPDGAECEADALCLRPGSCAAGICIHGSAVTCEPLECHAAGSCNPYTGECQYRALDDGAPCGDDSTCACSDGLCTCPSDIPHLACVGAADGSDCDDGNACTSEDVCQRGECVGQLVTCPDTGDPCRINACDPTKGCAIELSAPDLTPCYVTSDACLSSMEGVCSFGECIGLAERRSCANLPQLWLPPPERMDLRCIGTEPECNPATALCDLYSVLEVGAPCEDNDPCNGMETCGPDGTCQPAAAPLTCDVQPDGCTIARCVPGLGCSHLSFDPLPDGTPCGGDRCVVAECRAGECVVAEETRCDDGNACTLDTCDLATGCRYEAMPEGTPCGASDACHVHSCDGNGACIATPIVSCSPLDECHGPGVCDPVAGTCSYPVLPDGAPCDDGDACGAGVDACFQGQCVTCGSWKDACADVWCDVASGSCIAVHQPDGSACPHPESLAVCQGGDCIPIDCDDGNPCTHDTLVPQHAGCSFDPLPDGASCSDGDVCNGVETCQSGVCVVSSPLSCSQCDPVVGCTTANMSSDPYILQTSEARDPSSIPASYDPRCAQLPDGARCGDRSACDVLEQCQGVECVVTAAPGVSCVDDNACTLDYCHAETEECIYRPLICDDGNPCTVNACDPVDGCVFTWRTCDDNNVCTVDRCSAGDGGCVHEAIECGDDGDVCTHDHCDPLLGCQSEPITCDDGDLCTLDWCNTTHVQSGSQLCVNEPVVCAAGSACDPATGACVTVQALHQQQHQQQQRPGSSLVLLAAASLGGVVVAASAALLWIRNHRIPSSRGATVPVST